MNQTETKLPDSLFMDLDRSGPVPLYYQVAQRLEKAILAGEHGLPAGARLENEVSLGMRLGLSRPTIRRAIQELVDKGLVVRRRGIGTQVVHGQISRSVELTSLYEDLERAGQHPETVVLSHAIVEADERIAQILDVPEGSPTLHLARLRKSGGIPVAVMNNVLPPDLVDLDIEALNEHGLYQLLRYRGVTMRVAKQTIGARAATAEESDLLGVEVGGPLLTMSRVAFDNSGRAAEYGDHLYRPDLYSFEVTLVEK